MNPVKLAILINDTFEAVERSKVGLIYLKDADGNIIKDEKGSPYINTMAFQVFNSTLQAQIMRGNHEG